DRVRSQMEGACVMGVGVATLEGISFKGGRVEQDNFNAYQVTRMAGAPREIRVHIIPGDYSKPMGGVGEPGVPPIPPALCNAIFARESRPNVSDADRERLRQIQVTLDQCWDLLRQRRARRAAGLEPEDARVRNEKTVEGYTG